MKDLALFLGIAIGPLFVILYGYVAAYGRRWVERMTDSWLKRLLLTKVD